MHALVVDDSDVIRKILTAHLQKLGFQVTLAVNGRDALDRLLPFQQFHDLIGLDAHYDLDEKYRGTDNS